MRSTPNPLTVIISHLPRRQLSEDDAFATWLGRHGRELAPEIEGNGTDMAGLLVSSFNTVSLNPGPYVSFNIKLPSSTYAAIEASCVFTASGLKDARVADAFVKHKAAAGRPYGDGVWSDLVETDGRLKKGSGGTWWMRCRLQRDKCSQVGDHVIVVAKVVECGGYEGGEGIGLVYAEGDYRKVGEVVDIKEEEGID